MGTETALEVPQHVLDYLREQQTLTLATASPRAVPWATTLTYVNDGLALYVWTRPETTTARHMEQNPVAAFAIDEFTPDWREIQGIQGSGECHVVLGPSEVKRVVELFEEKFPSLSGALSANVQFFRLTPTEVQFIDNSSHGEASGVDFHRDLVYSVFRDLPEQAAQTLAAQLQTMEVGAGDVIVRQGAPADKFFIIVDGEVEVVREDDGQPRTLATLKRGQFFGEIAILRSTPRMATVKAVTPTTLFAMERQAFQGLVAQSMGTTQDFDRVIQQRLEEIGAGEAR
jgi:CRP-like cAMP-binding protein